MSVEEMQVLLEGMDLAIGGLTIGWSAVAYIIINLLRHLQIDGRPLLPTKAAKRAANAALAGVVLIVYGLLSGDTILNALLQAVTGVAATAGLYDLLGKGSGEKKNDGTDEETDGTEPQAESS